MKKIVLLLGVLLSLGMFCACSSDDEFSDLMDKKLSLFEDSLQSVPENNYTGRLYYDHHYGWTIIPDLIYYDYAAEYFFPVNLPDDFKSNKDESVKVSYSGKIIKMTDEEENSAHIWRWDSTQSFYYLYLTKIVKIEEDEIPYRGNPPFTITDMPGMMTDFNTGEWCIFYVKNGLIVNLYYPTELSEEFKVHGMKVNISGDVYEEVANNSPIQKSYKINLTKIDKAE